VQATRTRRAILDVYQATQVDWGLSLNGPSTWGSVKDQEKILFLCHNKMPVPVIVFDIDDTLTVPSCGLGPNTQCQSRQQAILRVLELMCRDRECRRGDVVYFSTARTRPTLRGVPPIVQRFFNGMRLQIHTADPQLPRDRESIASQKVQHLMQIAKQNQVPFACIILVDDNVHNCQAAAKAGFRAVQVPFHGMTDETYARVREHLDAAYNA